MNAKDGPRIFISAGETSGDLHAAGLVCALRRLAPGVKVHGLGGDRMEQAGCKLLARSTGTSLMFVDGIITQLATFMGMISA
ncbi:MAG: lipid-A-disaccharide synthase, partial [Phycisphaerae bacterium]|nr:lipid-A-disaccharide synthase [Phycisphaerae bacterium]